MGELNLSRVTDVTVSRRQRKDYMAVTVTVLSVDYNGIPRKDTTFILSKDKKIKVTMPPIEKTE